MDARRWQRTWRVGRYLGAVALGAVAVWAVANKSGELSGSATYLRHLRWGWVALAGACEVLSFLSFAAIQRRLLAAGKVIVALRPLVGVTLAGNAIQNSIPAGVVLSAAYSYRQYRRFGADEVLSAWVMVATTAVSFVTVACMAVAGLALAFGSGSGFNLVGVIVGVFVFAGVLVVGWTKRGWALSRAAGVLRLCQRIFRRPAGDTDALVRQGIDRLAVISPQQRDWAWAMLWAVGNWVTDFACLVLAFEAIGSNVPWRGVLLAYTAGQLATNLPVTPGGLGVVEGSLTVALVVFGGTEASTVAAVLVYRILSFWLVVPTGWASWATIAVITRRRPARRAIPAPVEEAVT